MKSEVKFGKRANLKDIFGASMWKTALTRKFRFKTEEIKDWMQKFDPVILGFK